MKKPELPSIFSEF